MSISEKVDKFDALIAALNTMIFGSDNVVLNGVTKPSIEKFLKGIAERGWVEEPFKTEQELLASIPTKTKAVAKAIDTSRVFLWDGDQWENVGLGDYEKSLKYVNDLSEKIIGSPIFQIEDGLGQITIVQTRDGKLHLPLMDESVQDAISKSADSIIKENSKNALEVRDGDGNLLMVIDDQMDLRIPSIPEGLNRKLSITNLDANPSTVHRSKKFLISSEALEVISAVGALKSQLSASVPLNQVPLRYTVPNSIVDLSLTQPAKTKIDTVYQKDDGIVHPNVIEFYDEFNHAKYWLGLTGYFETQDKFENPMLFKSNDLISFDMFDDYPQPLVERPVSELVGDHQYNSDIFMFYDFHSGELCMGYRTTRRQGTSATRNSISYKSTKDGVTWSDSKVIVPSMQRSDVFLSPSIIYDFKQNIYRLYVVDGENGRYELIRWDMDYAGSEIKNRTVIPTPRSFEPWHCDIRYVGDKIMALIHDNQSTENLYLGVSSDGGNSFTFGGPVLVGEFHKPYKATFTPVIDDINNQVALNLIWTSRQLPTDPKDRWRLYSQKSVFMNLESN